MLSMLLHALMVWVFFRSNNFATIKLRKTNPSTDRTASLILE